MKKMMVKVLRNAFEEVKRGNFYGATIELSRVGVAKTAHEKSWKRFWSNANRCIENGWDADKFISIMLNKYNMFTEDAYSSFVNEEGVEIPKGTSIKYNGEKLSTENADEIISELECSIKGKSQGVGAWDNLEFRAYHKLDSIGVKLPEELKEEVQEFYHEIYGGEYHTPSKESRTRFEQASYEANPLPQLPLDEVGIFDAYIDLRGGWNQGRKMAGRILLAETAAMKGLLSYITSPDSKVEYMWERFKSSARRALNMCPELLSEEDYKALKEIFVLIKKGKEEWLQKGFEAIMKWEFPPIVAENDISDEDMLF